MKCSSCGKKAVFDNPPYCKEHFISYFEKKVLDTIQQFALLQPTQHIAVAASGGKDSLSVLYLINKHFPHVTAIAIDEGIEGYRSKTIQDLEQFCKQQDIPLCIHSFQTLFNYDLDTLKKKESLRHLKPCTTCGILRRYALNRAVKDFDVIVTGHNLDDEAQTVMMNLFHSNLDLLARIGPKSGVKNDEKFVPRVKPLCFCSERETAAYSFLKGFSVKYSECPNAVSSFRAAIRDELNKVEQEKPGTKLNMYKRGLQLSQQIEGRKSETIQACEQCGEAAQAKICNACTLLAEV